MCALKHIKKLAIFAENRYIIWWKEVFGFIFAPVKDK